MKRDMISPSSKMAASGEQRPARNLRVCMLVYSFYESDTRVLQYATALAQRGDVVDVIALKRDPSLPDLEIVNGVNVHRIQSRIVNEKGFLSYAIRIFRFFWRSLLVLRKRHREHPYDIVHVHNVPDFLVFAAAFPKWKGVPVILDIHDLLPEFYASKFKVSSGSLLFQLLTFAERCSASFATHVIVANHLWRDRLAARSSRQAKCSVVRNHPDLDIFVAQAGQKVRTDATFQLTYPGSLNWHQGVDVAIRAFASIAGQIPEAQFHIYGDGAAKPSLIELANELKMQNRVIFHDLLPSRDIARVMAQTDLAIEPKRATSTFGNEALSTKILEFMALGVPIVASRTTIHAYYYDDSIIRYYDHDDAAQLAECILQMKRDPESYAQMARRAAVYAAENNWQAKKGEYLQLVDSLVAGGSPTAALNANSVSNNAFADAQGNLQNAAGISNRASLPGYVVLTAAYNEERFIERTIQSILAQTILPARWVIVSDGSTDRTDEIVCGYCARHAFMRLLRVEKDQARGVVRKVNALNTAYREVQDVEYGFLANLDADIVLSEGYFETLMQRFQVEPALGISGGLIYEERGGEFKARISNSVHSVAHAAQLVRRECYEAIGGYVPLKYGGEDWCAEVSARMKGWSVKAFSDLKVKHLRTTGAADRALTHCFRQGKMDHSIGSHPVFEILKCARRVPERPFAAGAVARLAGFFWSYATKEPRLVPQELAGFLRNEQKDRLKLLFNASGDGQ
jgi:glycosyltransferase involved in cell wall biosynthesis